MIDNEITFNIDPGAAVGNSNEAASADELLEQLEELRDNENYDDIPLDAEEISAELIAIRGQVTSLTAALENLFGAIEALPTRLLPILQTVLEMGGGGGARPAPAPKPTTAPASATEKSETRKAVDAANLATIQAIKERRS